MKGEPFFNEYVGYLQGSVSDLPVVVTMLIAMTTYNVAETRWGVVPPLMRDRNGSRREVSVLRRSLSAAVSAMSLSHKSIR